jgi:hypothetical protein
LALGEGDIPGRWAASPLPAGLYPLGLPPIFSSDKVRTDHQYWSQALILLDSDCRVVDQAGPRQLLLLRSRVLELCAMDMEHSGDRSLKQDQKLRSASKDQVREAAREVYKIQSGKKPPNMDEAEKLIRQKLPDARRNKIRGVLHEEEFTRQRLKPGNPPKK